MADRADDRRRRLSDGHRQETPGAGRTDLWQRERRLNTVEQQLRARIATTGPISVADYMAAANAHYYASRDPLGVDGDFITAPEISQMFGEIVGAALVDVWARAGSPADAIYAELGPGRGTLAADALRVMRGAGFAGEVHFVETSPALRTAQAARVPGAIFHDAIAALPDCPLLLVANEFFDALPVEQWIGEEQRRIAYDGTHLVFVGGDGPIEEHSPARDGLAEDLAYRLALNGGAAIIVDYGYTGGERGDTLQAVRGHQFANILERPGDQDLTAHVNFQHLIWAAQLGGAEPSRVVTQGSWLEALGIGPRAAALAARNPAQTEAIAAARRRLCDAAEMGQLFKVMALRHRDWPGIAGLES